MIELICLSGNFLKGRTIRVGRFRELCAVPELPELIHQVKSEQNTQTELRHL
jgi:hypothetical protein